MIQYLFLDTSKLLNISDITKRIGNFFKLPIQLYGVPYPELALIDGATATFYKYGDQIFSTDEYWEAIAKAQEALFNLDGSKPDANDLKGILTDITPSKEIAEEDIANNLVTPQITTISNIIAFYDADKNQLDATDVTNVNKKLYKSCRLMEKFTDGKCVFSIPIKHMGLKEKRASTDLCAIITTTSL